MYIYQNDNFILFYIIISPYWFICHCNLTVEQEKNFILDNMHELIERKQSELMAIKNYIKDVNYIQR